MKFTEYTTHWWHFALQKKYFYISYLKYILLTILLYFSQIFNADVFACDGVFLDCCNGTFAFE